MIFLTYNDNFSGIYTSQVIDVCAFIEKESQTKVKLVALVSMRNYSTQKKLIKSNYKNALVLPMFPKVQFWKMNTFLLFFVCLFSGHKKIWARGAFACNMALSLKSIGLVKTIIFDARGAYLAELTEYNVVQNESIKNNIADIEKKALEKSNAQLAVSQKLIDWWKECYNFIPKKCALIPCTLSTTFTGNFPTENEISKLRVPLGFSPDDIVLVYSGSSAGWQSFNLVDEYLYKVLTENKSIKLLFLSNEIPKDSITFNQFKERILVKWVKPEEVKNLLLAADYGLLIRENSITNQVASPVKFAEYLACGLQIIISNNIGDFTGFAKQNNCGLEYNSNNKIEPVSYVKKSENNNLALKYFTKEAPEIKSAYSKLLNHIET